MSVETPALPLGKKRQIPEWIDLPVAALYTLLGVLWVRSFRVPMQFDEDEGINLMKSLLVKRGYSLYQQIWSDQPPLFTLLYRWWADHFGWTINSGRTLVFLFSVLLLLSAGRLTRQLSGSRSAGWIACLLILGARRYLRLSVSVMIGLPAIAVAVTALWLFVSAVRRSSVLLAVLAGVVLGLSMEIKLFTFILLPAFVMAIVLVRTYPAGDALGPTSSLKMRVMLALSLIASAAITLWGMLNLFHAGEAEQLVAPHLVSIEKLQEMLIWNLTRVGEQLGQDFSLLATGAFAIIWAIFRRKSGVILPLTWFAASIAVLLFARPMQSHHRLMMSIPLAIASAITLDDAIRYFRSTRAADRAQYALLGSAVFLTLLTGVVSIGSIVMTLNTVGRKNLNMEPIVLSTLKSAPPDAWVMTDSPLFPFEAGLLVPPEIAVFSAKRVSNGEITPASLLGVMDRYQPLYVLAARFPLPQEVQARVDLEFDRVETTRSDRRLWRRKSVSPTTDAR